MVNVLDVLETI
jgi:hypothetical protein